MKVYDTWGRGEIDAIKHPVLPLYLYKQVVFDVSGDVVVYCDQGHQAYVFFYKNVLVVTEPDRWHSLRTAAIKNHIYSNDFYAFRIMCSAGVAAAVEWNKEVVLIGLMGGYLECGDPIFTPAHEVKNWPGRIK